MDPYELLLDCAASPHPLRWTPLVKACGRKLFGLLAKAIGKEPTCGAASQALCSLAPPGFAEVLLTGFAKPQAPACLRARLRAVLCLDPLQRPLTRSEQVEALLDGIQREERAWLPSMFETLDVEQRTIFLQQLPEALPPVPLAWTLGALFELSAEPRHRLDIIDQLLKLDRQVAGGPLNQIARQQLDTPAGTSPSERSRASAAGPSSQPPPGEPRVFICSPEGWSYDALLARPVYLGVYATHDVRMRLGGGLISSEPAEFFTLRGLWSWRRRLEAEHCLVAELPAGNGFARLSHDLGPNADALPLAGDFAVHTEFGSFFQEAEREAARYARASDRLYERPEFDFFVFLPHEFGIGDYALAAQRFFDGAGGDAAAPDYKRTMTDLAAMAGEHIDGIDGSRELLKSALRLFAEIYFYSGKRAPAQTLAGVHRALFNARLHEVPFTLAMLRHSIELELDGRILVEVEDVEEEEGPLSTGAG